MCSWNSIYFLYFPVIYILGKFFFFSVFFFVCFIGDIIHVSMLSSQIIPSSPSPTESKRLFYASVSLLFTHLSQVHWFRPLPSALCVCSYPVWVVFFVWVFFLIILFGSNFLVVIFNSFYFISEISLFFQLFQDAFKMFIEWVFLQLL